MAGTLQPQQLMDSAVVDPDGNKIGKVGNVYLADTTREPEWITVKTGLFGSKESFVPLSGANVDNDGVHVNVAKDQVSEAPRIDADGHLSSTESAELYRHYGLPMPRSAPDQGMAGGRGRQDRDAMNTSAGRDAQGTTAGRDKMDTAAGRGKQDTRGDRSTTDTRGEEMIRSEERLHVGTEQVETGHVRLRKYVVTEEQQVTVPVSHEEVRLEREPITDARGGTGRTELGEQEQDVVLHAEKPVISKETVAVERARLNTETVTEEQTVKGEVRKEQFDLSDDAQKRKH
ncbi:PRC and DUF2382 domain-containing protein [Amycolatopsis rhabdoformis]|uniref:PRC and DUF2382 domain-containing protein n=1 Tax=Amycolatopsis rhabdoformis TaxID=1448059 RepID=A0ABZ1INU0_9PSEU|nr:PRC and DUF2382 domain-containing protein [Amycolatopsis rhabdoformis]WSE35104.1 PRC and DUF2382 domain-containing protein [Amycolatopsis rhabdoformis]